MVATLTADGVGIDATGTPRHIRFWQMLALGGLLFVWHGRTVMTTAQSDEQQETYRQLGLFGDVFQRIRDLMSTRLRTRNWSRQQSQACCHHLIPIRLPDTDN